MSDQRGFDILKNLVGPIVTAITIFVAVFLGVRNEMRGEFQTLTKFQVFENEVNLRLSRVEQTSSNNRTGIEDIMKTLSDMKTNQLRMSDSVLYIKDSMRDLKEDLKRKLEDK